MEFWLTIFHSAAIASIAAVGLFLQIRSGQFNAGMAVFVGVGGYVSGALSVRFGMPPIFSIPISVAAGFAFGMFFSALTLRLHHWFFALTTLALSLAAVSAASMLDFLGGALGLVGIAFISHPAPAFIGLALVIGVTFLIERSAVGLAIRATGDDQILAELFGVRVRSLRVLIFGVGAAFAALAGALHAHRFGVYQPTDMSFHPSLLLLVYVLVGGKNTVWGPVLGTFFLFTIPEVIVIAPEVTFIVFGSLLVLVATAIPDGLAGAVALLFRKRRKAEGGATKSAVESRA